ncbi:MAG: glutamine synthetase, partial [Pseudomonadota bacterium]
NNNTPPADAPYESESPMLPTTLRAALVALQGGNILPDAFGRDFIDYFAMIKAAELARFESTVTDWEMREYFDLF